MSNRINTENQKNESSRIYTLYYSFFLIPFMIAVFGAVFFLLFKFITYETNDASELLNQVKIGSKTKRWQSAYELSKVLNNPKTVPENLGFKNQMIASYKHAINDDPLVRAYLAIAMGATGDEFYADELVIGMKDKARDIILMNTVGPAITQSGFTLLQLLAHKIAPFAVNTAAT